MAYKKFTWLNDAVVPAASYIENKGITEDHVQKVVSFVEERFPEAEADIGQGGRVTILLEASGSMRGRRIKNATAAILRAGDALEAAGRDFEILAHTTREWKGGQSKIRWVEKGRSKDPGRLGDLMHIIFKGADEPWSETRKNLSILVMEMGLLKENIDGEALQWAVRRMRKHDDPGSLIVISDGPPIDDATLAFNSTGYLAEHLREVFEEVSDIPMRRIVIGDDIKHDIEANPLSVEWPDQVAVEEGNTNEESVAYPLILAEIARATKDLEKEPDALEPS